jgi:Sulfotransferase domain
MRSRVEGPDFVGVGVPKAGTTWLARVLASHPQVFLGTKEIAFYTRHFHRGYGWYQDHFREKGDRVAGEITPSYLITPREASWRKEFYPRWNPRRPLLFWRRMPSARNELRARYPGIKVFAILRDPSARAWAYYWHWRKRKDRLGKPVVPFEKMFHDDGRWIRSTGYYAHWLERWREAFPDFQVWFTDDLKDGADSLVREVYRFIGVDESFRPPLEGAPNPGRYEPLPPETRGALVAEYDPHIRKLEELTGRDLSSWRE